GVRATAAFQSLSREEFDWALALVEHGGATLRAYPEYHRVVPNPVSGLYHVPSPRIAQMHRLNVGTITGETTVPLRYVSGRSIGSIEEHFVAHLRPGDRFFFAARTLEFVRVHDLVAYLRPARARASLTPIWGGTRLPIAEALGEAVRGALERGGRSEPGASAGAEPELDA